MQNYRENSLLSEPEKVFDRTLIEKVQEVTISNFGKCGVILCHAGNAHAFCLLSRSLKCVNMGEKFIVYLLLYKNIWPSE